MKNYLVIGGAGMIGSTLVKRLLREGHDVMVIDDLSTGTPSNLPTGFAVPGFKIPIIKKISMINDVRDIDGIFHLGMPCSSPLYKEDPYLVGKVIKEFIDIMEYAKKNKIKVVWASTSSVYNGNISPYHEDMAIYPADFYAEARYYLERLAKVYYNFYDIKSIALRFFSVYGPNEKSKGIYANLVSQIMWSKQKNESIDIYNNGKGARDFIHVDDVVRACIMAMNSNIDFDVLNIGTGKAYEMNDIIKAVGLTNFRYTDPPNIVKNFKFPDTLADISKTKTLLGFESKINVLEYLQNIKL